MVIDMLAIGTDKFLIIYFEGQFFDITPLKADITGATIATTMVHQLVL